MKIKCIVCEQEKDSEDFLNKRLQICSDECFLKDFWNSKVKWAEKDDQTSENLPVARIDGEHYVIGDEDSTSYFRGCAGGVFFIKFLSGKYKGKVLRTTNLW